MYFSAPPKDIMRKIAAGIFAVATAVCFSTPASASPLDTLRLLDTNYLASADCASLNATLTSLNLVTGPTTKSELAAKIKATGTEVTGAWGIGGGDAQLIVNKAAVDVSNRALECGIVKEDPKVMGSIEMPQQLADLKILLSS